MFARFPKKTLFLKIIVLVLNISFLFTNIPLSYANTDALRTPSANRSSATLEDMKVDLGKTVKPEKIDPLVLTNILSLLEGAQTGGYNMEHAILDGAQGVILDHSERRGRLETTMNNLLMTTLNLRKADASEETVKKNWEDTLKTENLSDKEREKVYIEFSKGSYWMSRALSPDNAEALEAVNWGARMIVDYIMNLQLKKIIAYSDKYKIEQTVLCLGETLAQYSAKRTQEVLRQDLKDMLTGITKEDARKIGLRVAYEPRWAIGTGKTPTSGEIQTTHRFIKDTVKGILGTELDVDYGGSLSEKNCAEFLALPDVDGGLIGSAAKTPAAISPVIDEAIKQGEKKGKLLNIGMNWKAEDSKSGLSPVDAFVELFRTKDLSKVHIAIGTPNVKLVRDIMTKLEDEISAVFLYSGIVVKTENIGPFTKETLAAKSPATKNIYTELEKRFGEDTFEGDVYFRLKTGNKYFALAKENTRDQTLMTAATLDLTDPKTKDEYFAALLSYVSLVTTQTGKGIELIEEKGDRFKEYLSGDVPRGITTVNLLEGATFVNFLQDATLVRTLGIESVVRYWYGQDRFFQMEYKPVAADPKTKPTLITFKETNRPLARGWSLIVQPKITVLVNGYGTIGSKAAQAALKSGFSVAVTVGSRAPRIQDANEKGYPVYVTDPGRIDALRKSGIFVAGTLEEGLASGNIDVVIDATPGGTGATNLKSIYKKYPNLKVILEGGEKANLVESSFSSSTNFDAVKGKNYVRVVSCNTTGMARIYGQLAKVFSGLNIDNLALRRGADPGELEGPNPDSISVIPAYHHGPDFRTILPKEVGVNIAGLNTDAGEVPETHYHVHVGTIRGGGITVEKVMEILKAQTRVGLIEFPKGEFKTPILFEIFNSLIPDANHPYIVPVQVMASSIEGEVKLVYAVPQESNVVPENINALQSMFGLYDKDAAIRLVDEVLGIDKIKAGLETRLPVSLSKAMVTASHYEIPKAEPKVAEQVTVPATAVTAKTYESEWTSIISFLDDIQVSELKGKTIVDRVDWNIPSMNSIIRIKASIPGILKVIKNGGTVVVATHYGRPGGKVNPKYSVKPLADRLRELLKEQGEADIAEKVNFLEGSVTEKGLQDGLKAKIKPGAINILENTRFCPGDEKNDPAFAKALAALGDIFNFAGFGAGERVHASTAGLAEYMDRIVLDPLVVKEERIIRGLLNNLYGVIFGGGPKVSEKITTLRSIVENMKEGGYVIIGTGPLPAFLKAMYNIEIGQKADDADVAAAGEIIELAKKMKVRVLLPSDFVALNTNLFEKAEGDKTWFDLKKIPASTNKVDITLEHLKRGNYPIFIYDIGPTSRFELAQVIRNTPKGSSIFWNGSVGINEMAEFETGTKDIALTLAEVSKNDARPEGVNVVSGGGDTAAATEQFEVDQKFTYVSTGGGASLALLEGKELTAITKLTEIQSVINTAAKLEAGVNDYRAFVNSDRQIYNVRGGRALHALVNNVATYSQAVLADKKIRAIIVAPGLFKAGGLKSTLEDIAQLSKTVKIALYGEKAEKLKILLGNGDIVTGNTLDEALAQLSKSGIPSEEIVLLKSSADKLDATIKVKAIEGEISAIVVAKALKELFKDKTVDDGFAKFYEDIKTQGVISEQAYSETREAMMAKLQEGTFALPENLKITEQVENQIQEARKISEEFMDRV